MNLLLISNNDFKKYLNKHKITKCLEYKDIIFQLEHDYDAIIIDGLANINVLELLYNYPNPVYLNRTIIIDNNYACYNLLNNSYQLFAILDSHKIEYLDYYILEIEKRNILYNIEKANIYEEISIILKKLGLSPDKDGFHYLRKAIYESYNNPVIQKNYTELYTLLEETFSTNRKDIERSMRYSISIGYIKSDYEYSERLFSNILSLEQSYPKNSEFIAVVLEELFRIHHRTIY